MPNGFPTLPHVGGVVIGGVTSMESKIEDRSWGRLRPIDLTFSITLSTKVLYATPSWSFSKFELSLPVEVSFVAFVRIRASNSTTISIGFLLPA